MTGIHYVFPPDKDDMEDAIVIKEVGLHKQSGGLLRSSNPLKSA